MRLQRLDFISLVALAYFSVCFYILEFSPSNSKKLEAAPFNSSTHEQIPATQLPDIDSILNNPEVPIQEFIPAQSYSHLFKNLPEPYLNKSICNIAELPFTEEEFRTKWNYNTYGKCITATKDEFNISNNIINAKCANGNEASMLIEDGNIPQTLGGLNAARIHYKPGNTQSAEKGEFSIIRCDPNTRYPLIHSRFNPEVSKRVQATRFSISATSKPLSVLILLFDSISIQSAHQNLPIFTSLLNSQFIETPNHEKFVSYEFTKVNSEKLNTMDNIVPLLYGQSLEENQKILKDYRSTSNGKDLYLELQQRTLWKYYSSLGYVTMFTYDTVFDYLKKSSGKTILADHVFTNFWKVAKRVYGYSDFLNKQRCFGIENAHFFSLNYTYQFFQNYRDHNRFAYVHISAAHEDSGNVRTIDDDLVAFINNMMSIHNGTNEDLMMIIMADHGRGNPNLHFNIKMHLDHKRPMTFIVMNKELNEKIGGDILKQNQQRLIGRFDMNLSLKSIAKAPYGEYIDKNYNDLKRSYVLSNVVSIFHEQISIARNCSDLLISEGNCICKDFDNVDFRSITERNIVAIILNLTEQYVSEKRFNNRECENAEILSIISAKKFSMEEKSAGWVSAYFLDIEIQKKNRISINATFVKVQKYVESKYKIADIKTPKTIEFIEEVEVLIYINSVYIVNHCNKENCIC